MTSGVQPFALAFDKDRRINICRIVAFRSAKAAFFRGAKDDTCFFAGAKHGQFPCHLVLLGHGKTTRRAHQFRAPNIELHGDPP